MTALPGPLGSPGSGAPGPGLGRRIYGLLRSIPTWALWLLVVLWTIPTLGLFINSFRVRNAQRTTGWWNLRWEDFTFENYTDILAAGAQGGMWRALLSSIAIALPATVIPIAIAAFAAYAFAWIDFKGREWLFIATVSLLAIPTQMSLIPLLRLYTGGGTFTIPFLDKTLTLFPDLDLAGGVVSVWLTHTGFALPFAIFLLHNYISSLPKDIFESAVIDGADHFKVFWRLVLPLSVPVLAAFAIFQFLWTYNDYLIAVTMLGAIGENYPATARIASLSGEFGQAEHLLTAGAFLSAVLPIAVFFGLQRYFVTGILAGSVKG